MQFNVHKNLECYDFYGCVRIFFAGLLSTSKAIISEISDDNNQALGLTLVGTAWGTGFIIGPAVSGAIADPIGQYHLNITGTVNSVNL